MVIEYVLFFYMLGIISYVSSGCISMYNNEIIKVYDKVQIGTFVTVKSDERVINATIDYCKKKDINTLQVLLFLQM